MNKHGPGCNFCAHEKSRMIRAGFRGLNRHWYCDNQKPCNGFLVKPPEYKQKVICATYRGGGLEGVNNARR
jgi:hypothetical protein